MMNDIDLLTAVGLERGELRVQQAAQVEAAAKTLRAEAQGNVPTDASQRQAYQAKAAELQKIVDDMLDNIADTCGRVPELVRRLSELDDAQQISVLRDYLGSILDGQAATSRAMATGLQTIHEIEHAVDKSLRRLR
jgi:hypothetical protein